MKVIFVRQLCGAVGSTLFYLYLVVGLEIHITKLMTIVVLVMLFLISGFIHIIRLKQIPMVRFEALTCSIESILVAIFTIVCLTLLTRLGSQPVFFIGMVVSLVALLIYPSHVLRWDYDHGLR